MVDVFKADGTWSEFNIVGDLGAMPNISPMADADYAALCAISNTLGGGSWRTKWITNKNVQTASRWRGVTFDEDGYVTSIDLSNNRLSGDVSELSFSGLTKLKSLNLSSNALTGDIQSLAASLPKGCTLNVEQQELGYIGEYTLYEVCELTQEAGLPSIAYWRSDANTLEPGTFGNAYISASSIRSRQTEAMTGKVVSGPIATQRAGARSAVRRLPWWNAPIRITSRSPITMRWAMPIWMIS